MKRMLLTIAMILSFLGLYSCVPVHQSRGTSYIKNISNLLGAKISTLSTQDRQYKQCKESKKLNMEGLTNAIAQASLHGYNVRYIFVTFGCEYLNSYYFIVSTKVEGKTVAAFGYNSDDKVFRKIKRGAYSKMARIANLNNPLSLIVDKSKNQGSDPVLRFVIDAQQRKIFTSLSSNRSIDYKVIEKFMSLLQEIVTEK